MSLNDSACPPGHNTTPSPTLGSLDGSLTRLYFGGADRNSHDDRMIPLLLIAAPTLVGIAGFAGLLHLIPRLGAAGTGIGAWLCRAPGLDLVVSLFTWIPPTVLGIVLGWRGVVGSIVGQVLGMLVWMFAHELANRKHVNGPRIVTFLNRTVGRLTTTSLSG